MTNVFWAEGKWETFFLSDISRQFIQGEPEDGDEVKDDHLENDRTFRYRFLWEHTQEFGPGAGWLNGGRLMWEVDLLSDIDVPLDFFRDDYKEHGPRDTWLDFTIPLGLDNEVSLYFVKRINDFYTTYERLPELRHVFKKRRVLTIPALDIPVYYESRSRAGYYNYVESEDREDEAGFSVWRAWTDQKISMPKRYFGFLNVEPFFGLGMAAGHVSSYTRGETYQTNANGLNYVPDFFVVGAEIFSHKLAGVSAFKIISPVHFKTCIQPKIRKHMKKSALFPFAENF